jgi:hypothetical protein
MSWELQLRFIGQSDVHSHKRSSFEYLFSRARSLHAKDEKESEMLKELWQTAHDICSLAACNMAFEDCKEEDGYDLG